MTVATGVISTVTGFSTPFDDLDCRRQLFLDNRCRRNLDGDRNLTRHLDFYGYLPVDFARHLNFSRDFDLTRDLVEDATTHSPDRIEFAGPRCNLIQPLNTCQIPFAVAKPI